MKDDAIIAVQVRLKTAEMALQSAISEAAQPVEERDNPLMERLLWALLNVHRAQEMCAAYPVEVQQ